MQLGSPLQLVFLQRGFLITSASSVVKSPSIARPSPGGIGTGPSSSSGMGGFVPSNQWVGLVGEKMLGFCAPPSNLSVGGPSTVIECSPQFLLGMSWKAQQPSFVYEVGESSKGGDLGGGDGLPRDSARSKVVLSHYGDLFQG